MEVPQGKTAPKRTRRSQKVADFVEFSIGDYRGRMQMVAERAQERFMEFQMHDGKVELVNARLSLRLLSLPIDIPDDPKLKDGLMKAAMAFAQVWREAMASTAPRPAFRAEPHTETADEKRRLAGWKAADEARVAVWDAWAKEHGAESWVALSEGIIEQAKEAAEQAETAALAEYDAAHGTAEA